MAYEKCRGYTRCTMNGMPSPGDFNDEFNVPAEMLFSELCEYDDAWEKEREIFKWRLVEWVFHRKEWDVELFSKKRKDKCPIKKYEIYLELFYRCDNLRYRPFSKRVIIDNVIIEWCKKKDYIMLYEKYKKEEQNRRNFSDSNYISKIHNSNLDRRFPKINKHMEKYVHTVKITAFSTSSYSATVLALEKLDILLDCLNVAQGIQKYSIRLFDNSHNGLGSKTVFVTTGHYLSISDDGIDIYYTNDQVKEIPPNKYDYTEWNRNIFKKILASVSEDCFIRDRIRNVVRDLCLAYDSTNAGIKLLNYWRCLEHATRCPKNKQREKEIIAILQSMYGYKYWKQMGVLVLRSRNNYVHSGIYSGKEEFVDQYMNWAQKYAEQALFLLLRLYKNRKIYNNEEKLEAFFDNCSKNDEYIQAVNRIPNIIKDANKNL